MEFIVYISVCNVCKIKKSNERVEKKIYKNVSRFIYY